MAEKTVPDSSPIAEISHGPSGFETFLDNHQKKLILLGILIALGLAAWVIKDGIQDGNNLTAGNALVAANDAADFEAVMNQHPGTPSVASAAVLLSDSQWEQGEQVAAIATLRAEIAANPEHPATSPAFARLAARLSSQGKTEEAKAAFQDILDRPQAEFYAPYALVSLGQIAKSEGDIEKAKDYFTRARDGYPGNPLADSAGKAMQFVEFKMPLEIDPPAPEEDTSGIDNFELDPTKLPNNPGGPLSLGMPDAVSAPPTPEVSEPETNPTTEAAE